MSRYLEACHAIAKLRQRDPQRPVRPASCLRVDAPFLAFHRSQSILAFCTLHRVVHSLIVHPTLLAPRLVRQLFTIHITSRILMEHLLLLRSPWALHTIIRFIKVLEIPRATRTKPVVRRRHVREPTHSTRRLTIPLRRSPRRTSLTFQFLRVPKIPFCAKLAYATRVLERVERTFVCPFFAAIACTDAEAFRSFGTTLAPLQIDVCSPVRTRLAVGCFCRERRQRARACWTWLTNRLTDWSETTYRTPRLPGLAARALDAVRAARLAHSLARCPVFSCSHAFWTFRTLHRVHISCIRSSGTFRTRLRRFHATSTRCRHRVATPTPHAYWRSRRRRLPRLARRALGRARATRRAFGAGVAEPGPLSTRKRVVGAGWTGLTTVGRWLDHVGVIVFGPVASEGITCREVRGRKETVASGAAELARAAAVFLPDPAAVVVGQVERDVEIGMGVSEEKQGEDQKDEGG